MCQKIFFYIHTKVVTKKIGEKKRTKQFIQKHSNRASKKCREKIVRKKFQNRFLYSHEYHAQKMVGKTREIIFPEPHK